MTARSVARRVALLSVLWVGACGGGGPGLPAEPPPPPPGPPGRYATLSDAFAGAVSPYFGITAGREPKDLGSTFYRVPAPTGDNTDDLTQAWFEVGNSDLLVSVDANGRMEYPVVRGPLVGHVEGAVGGEVAFGPLDFLTGGRWSLGVGEGVAAPTWLPTLPGTSVDLVDGAWWRFAYTLGTLAVEMLPFAPEDPATVGPYPRGLVVLVRITNRGGARFEGTLAAPAGVRDADRLDATLPRAAIYGPAPAPIPANHAGDSRNFVPRFSEVGPAIAGYDAVAAVGDTRFAPGTTDVSLSLAPGESTVATLALLVGGGVSELRHTRDALRARSPLAWLDATAEARAARRGELSIPADPYVAELFGRHVDIARDAYLRTGAGLLRSPRGGSWLLMAKVAPDVLAATIPGGDLGVTCPVADARASLYQTTLPLVVAGLTWKATGDPLAFSDTTRLASQVRCLLDAITAIRHPGVDLFPATRIWDGPARGDFHTGSNLLAWYAFQASSRLAVGVLGDPGSATTWATQASAVKAAIEARCVVPGRYGPQLAEGTFADGRIDADVLCHDGEEIAVATAPLLGFAEADDPRVTNHGAAALSDQNRFYNPALGGMYWSEDAPVTAPGWIVALSGAAGERGVQNALAQWRRLTDVDGSMYWWHYDHPETDPFRIRRRGDHSYGGVLVDTPKADYATSVFSALLAQNVLGLDADVAARTASFRPVPPWPSFRWTKARAGRASFDVEHLDDGAAVTATLRNRNAVPYVVDVEVVVPTGKVARGAGATGFRYGRDARRVTATVAPGATLTAILDYGDPDEPAPVAAAWSASVAAHDANPQGSFAADGAADLDGNGLPEAYEWRLLCEARNADPEVEAAWQANRALGASLGWGDWWATICADYATVSPALAGIVNQWCLPQLPFVPFRTGGRETLAARADFDGDGRTNEAEYLAVGARDALPAVYGRTAATKAP